MPAAVRGLVGLCVVLVVSSVARSAGAQATGASAAGPATGPATGPAEPDESSVVDRRDEEARNLFHAGEVAFGDGRFESALDSFERAYELSGRGAMLYNIASAADRLRRDREALDAFERYLREVPDASNRGQVEARIEVLRASLASAESAERAAREATARTDTVQPSDAVPAGPNVGAWTLVGVGAAFAIGGGVSLGLAAADVASVENAARDTEWARVADAYGRSETESIAGAVLLGVGGAAMAAGLVWALLPSGDEGTSDEGASDGASVTVSVAPTGLVMRGTF